MPVSSPGKPKKLLSDFTVWLTSSILLFAFGMTAAAQSNQKTRMVRSQVKIARLQSEISGTKFEPSLELIKTFPDVVKEQMRLFKQHSAEFDKVNDQVKQAKVQLTLYERLFKQKAASRAEVRQKTHEYGAAKAKLLRMRTQTLVELETEMMSDAQYNNEADMPLKIQMARISAELNEKPFEPTQAMITAAPEFVKMQQEIFNAHNDYTNIIDTRVAMADEELNLAKKAFDNGVISKSEYLIIKTAQNNLVSESLNIHCKILNRSEQIKIESAGGEKSVLAKELKMARVKAQANQTPFEPTAQMQEMVPELVELEKELYKCNKSRMQRLDNSEKMLAEKYQIAQKAHKAGVATNVELNVARMQLKQFQDYHQRVKEQFKKEMHLITASTSASIPTG